MRFELKLEPLSLPSRFISKWTTYAFFTSVAGMKTLLTFSLGLMFSILTAIAGDLKIGDSVAAPWTNDKGQSAFFMATIKAISGDKADLLYEDGDKLTVPLSSLRALSADASFKVGDHVVAAWKGAQMFPGVVTAVTDLTCTIKWDDGDTPIEVKKSRIFLAPK